MQATAMVETELKEVNYSISLIGDSPKKLLSEQLKLIKEQKERGEIVDHPLLHAQSFNMLSIPEGMSVDNYINNLLKSKALKLNEVNCIILSLGKSRKSIRKEVASGRCTTNDNIHKGVRKWTTYHVLYEEHVVVNSKGETQYDAKGHPITRLHEISAHITKGEALSAAKDYATDYETEVIIELERRLDGSYSRIAKVAPIMRDEIIYEEVPDNHFKIFGVGHNAVARFNGMFNTY